MIKHSYEFKKKLVLEYLKNQGSYNFIAHKYGMASSSQLKRWVAAYNNFGNTGLKRLASHRFYSFSAKLSVVQCYLTGKVSYQKLALRMGINNPSIITKWVRDYKNTGPDALMPHKKGRKSILRKMRVRKTKSQGKQTVVDANVEYIRELEGELQKLRLENAFLKELRRLRLEDETKMRELRKSSAVSEDHSD